MDNLIKQIEKLKKENTRLKKQIEKIQDILSDKKDKELLKLNTDKGLQELEKKL